MAHDDEGNAPKLPAAPKLMRREFIHVGVVGSLSLAAGCSAATTSAPDDGGMRADARPEMRDGGAPVDAPVDPPVDASSPPTDAGPPVDEVPPPEEVTEGTDFAMAVASGDVTPSTAILWTHYAGSRELELVAAQRAFEAPERMFVTERVG